ncbi:MAG: hypothetical protein R6T90_00005 [Dissulfuribacterales bacterium]
MNHSDNSVRWHGDNLLLSFAMFIILSIAFNRMPALKAYAPTLADKKVI